MKEAFGHKIVLSNLWVTASFKQRLANYRKDEKFAKLIYYFLVSQLMLTYCKSD